MFASLPKTNEIIKLKNDLLSNMEDKYNELKSEGRSENEAVGIVISEFGNIDELMNELGIEHGTEGDAPSYVSEEEVDDYLIASRKSGKIIGRGVFLCIIAPALLILSNVLLENNFISGVSENVADILGLIPLFILIAMAVGLFIYSGMLMEKYKYIESEVVLPAHVRSSLQRRNDAFRPTYTLSVIVGVTLCILSPVILFITSTISDSASEFGVVLLLFTIAVAVYIFIYFGTIRESMSKLLKLDEYSHASKVKRKEDRFLRAVSAVIWPLATCFYLYTGFVYNRWHINWVVFPIVGILFGMLSGVCSILKEKN
jgi:hypothetical protein